uniref:Uncharacterized protein n=1 Tax=Utricularia reniformis TaxID=192314 RepID=A0A1Y0B4G3_9LAMI|nr:hypothetical protein AEK19_MT2062 [Utricularia reniformis]ART32219.1 hypothetical protein AEK19_MT2062 [Utricularia reniformis]
MGASYSRPYNNTSQTVDLTQVLRFSRGCLRVGVFKGFHYLFFCQPSVDHHELILWGCGLEIRKRILSGIRFLSFRVRYLPRINEVLN